MFLRSILFATLVAVSTSAAAPAEKVFGVTGVVRAPLANGQLVVAHEDIAGLMPAMTMAFAVSNPAEAAPLAVGDRVRFQLHVTDDAMRMADIKVIGRTSTSAAPRAAGAKARAPRLREGDAVPDFALVDENDQPFTSREFQGRATIVTFIFTRCPVPEFCPAMTLRFGQLQKAITADPNLAGRTRLVSITLDPEFDRPAVLKAYGEAVGATPAVWRFATGDAPAITALTQSFAVFRERNGVTLDHTLCTALIGPDGRVAEIWRGSVWQVSDALAALTKTLAP